MYNVYRPVHHTDNTSGEGIVWSQHREVLLKNNITIDPRQHILDSLLFDIAEDQRMNRQTLILGDFNENMFDLNSMNFSNELD